MHKAGRVYEAGTKDAKGVPGSNQTWFAAIGPKIQSKGVVAGHWKQSQIAATALRCLGLDAVKLMPQADKAMEQLLASSATEIKITALMPQNTASASKIELGSK